MRQRSRKSRHQYFVLVGMLLLVGVIVVPAAAAVASTPSQDQYTFNLPTPQGQKPASGQAPVAQPNDLSPSQQAAASGPDSSQLTQIATSPQLGAPQTASTGHGSKKSKHSDSAPGTGGGSGNSGGGPGTKVDLAGAQPAVPAAVSNTVGGGPVLGLFAVLAAIAVAGAFTAVRRRRGGTGGAGR